jgi:hypothetical protein
MVYIRRGNRLTPLPRGAGWRTSEWSLSCGTGRKTANGARVSAKRGPAAAVKGWSARTGQRDGDAWAEQGGVAVHRVVRRMEGGCRVLDLLWT